MRTAVAFQRRQIFVTHEGIAADIQPIPGAGCEFVDAGVGLDDQIAIRLGWRAMALRYNGYERFT